MRTNTHSTGLRALTVIYFIVSFVEIIAEYYRDTDLIWYTKPLIIPLLIVLYWKTSKKVNPVFVFAMACSWVANLFFISQDYDSLIIGAFIFLLYRILIIYVVLRLIKLPGILPMIIGSMPFVFIYLYVINVAYEAIGQGIYMFVLQGLFISFLGGFSVGNYILRSNKANTLLLISTMMFAFTQFIFVIKLYYLSVNIFQPLAMTLFVIGQFILYRFVLIAEKKKTKYQIVNNSPV